MNILGDVIRLQYKDGTTYQSVELERNNTLTIAHGWVKSAGNGRGVGHVKQISSWTVQASVLISSETQWAWWWNELSSTSAARMWRVKTYNANYRGEAFVSSLAAVGSKGGVMELQIVLQGNGALIKS